MNNTPLQNSNPTESGTQALIASLAQKAETQRIWSAPLTFSLWLLFSFSAVAIGMLFLGPRPDLLTQLSEPLYLFEILSPLLLSVGAAVLAIQLRRPDADQSTWMLYALTSLFGLSLSLLLVSFCLECFSSAAAFTIYWKAGLACATGMIVVSLAPTVFLFWASSKAAPTQVFRASLLSSLSGVSLAALTINLYCSVDQSLHHLLWVALPAFALLALGSSFGQKWIRW